MPWALWGLGLRCLSIAVCFLSLDVDRNGAHLKNWCWQENIIMLLFESECELPLHPLQWIIIVHAEIPVFFFGEDVWDISWYILFFRHSTGTIQKLLWKPAKQCRGAIPRASFENPSAGREKFCRFMTQMMKSSKACQFLGIHLVKPTWKTQVFCRFNSENYLPDPFYFWGSKLLNGNGSTSRPRLGFFFGIHHLSIGGAQFCLVLKWSNLWFQRGTCNNVPSGNLT